MISPTGITPDKNLFRFEWKDNEDDKARMKTFTTLELAVRGEDTYVHSTIKAHHNEPYHAPENTTTNPQQNHHKHKH
jgi:hypothetical protein